MTPTIQLTGDSCDRCGSEETTQPYKLTDSITYRGKEIVHAWLCLRCFIIEKTKFWKGK